AQKGSSRTPASGDPDVGCGTPTRMRLPLSTCCRLERPDGLPLKGGIWKPQTGDGTSGDIAAYVASVASVLFKQFVDDDLGCASYLVGDEHTGVAAVVDPAYAIEQYLDECERRDVRLACVLETHTHADHVSGHGRLALEHGVPVRVHEVAGATFPHEALKDGDEIALGDVVIRT